MKTMFALVGALLLFSTPATAQTTVPTTPDQTVAPVNKDVPNTDPHFIFVSKDKQKLVVADEVATSPEGFKRVLLIAVLAEPQKTQDNHVILLLTSVTTVDCTKDVLQIHGMLLIDDNLAVAGGIQSKDPEAWQLLPTEYTKAVCDVDYQKNNDLGNSLPKVIINYYNELTAVPAA